MTRAKKIGKNTWRNCLLLCGIPCLLLAAGLWWWQQHQPKQMRLDTVVELPTKPDTHSYVLLSGVFTRTWPGNPSPWIFTMFRWDGGTRWQVTVPVPYRPHAGMKPLQIDEYITALSPDARCLALFASDGQSQYVLTWRDGRVCGRARVCPLAQRQVNGLEMRLTNGLKKGQLLAMNNGRVLCWFLENDAYHVYLVEGDRLIATGNLTVSRRMTLEKYVHAPPSIQNNLYYPEVGFSGDGRVCLISDPPKLTAYSVTVSGATLRLTPMYSAHEPAEIVWGGYNFPFLSSSGTMVSPHGSLYDRRGRISGPSGWYIANVIGNNWFGMTDAVVQFRETLDDVGPQPYMGLRILIPKERASWMPPEQKRRYWCIPSVNGRFALTDDLPPLPMDERIGSLLERSPLAGYYQKYREHRGTLLSLYERPGCLRAYLHLAGRTGFGGYINSKRGRLVSDDKNAGYVSEDGHSVYLLTNLEKDRSRHFILRYRW